MGGEREGNTLDLGGMKYLFANGPLILEHSSVSTISSLQYSEFQKLEHHVKGLKEEILFRIYAVHTFQAETEGGGRGGR